LSWRDWRVAAALLALLIGLHVGSQYWRLASARSAEATLDARLVELGRSLLPGAAIEDVRAVRRAAAERLGGPADTDDVLLEALTAFAQARAAAPETRVEALRYERRTLDLQLLAPSADAVDQIGSQLRAAGWQAELLSGAAARNGYESRMRISRGAG
ncbi:MAG: hypothetical protein NZM12_06955, partial [Steroidobacteraceae bacterium]|nr:hypothetical protein [Steroidobacteraceae bacterium]